MEFRKIEMNYKFKRKRNNKLITPCCGRPNTDGKFVNYIGLEDNYGYCHSCGKTTLPPPIYENEKGEKYIWDDTKSKLVRTDGLNNIIIPEYKPKEHIPLKYIDDHIVFESVDKLPENSLMRYIRNTYGNEKTDDMIDWYLPGTTTCGKTQFWYIDINRKVRKDKIVQYDTNGKRTNNISSSYLNSQGYKSCLFGEHLLSIRDKEKDIIILVESEKTALIASILLPKYVWLSYGSINGLTDDRIKVLSGFRVLIIPDMSEKAVAIINSKIQQMKALNINVNIWDMTNGRSDVQLKADGIYNQDLEDLLRNIKQ